MKLTKYFPWFNEAWGSYTQCRSTLWWPLSFLLLAPLAALIVFGAIIPLGLNNWGLISFNYWFINYPYMVLVAGLTYFSLFPFLDGLYQTIKAHLEGQAVNEDTGFGNLFNSRAMGMSMGPILGMMVVLQIAGALFAPFKIAVLMAYILAIFTPILSVNNPESPWKKGLESMRFVLDNKKLVGQVWGLRLAIVLGLALPWILLVCVGSAVLKIIIFLFALPTFIYILVKIVPFYFFYPAYVYQQLQKSI